MGAHPIFVSVLSGFREEECVILIIEETFNEGFWALDWLESTEAKDDESEIIQQLYAQMMGWA